MQLSEIFKTTITFIGPLIAALITSKFFLKEDSIYFFKSNLKIFTIALLKSLRLTLYTFVSLLFVEFTIHYIFKNDLSDLILGLIFIFMGILLFICSLYSANYQKKHAVKINIISESIKDLENKLHERSIIFLKSISQKVYVENDLNYNDELEYLKMENKKFEKIKHLKDQLKKYKLAKEFGYFSFPFMLLGYLNIFIDSFNGYYLLVLVVFVLLAILMVTTTFIFRDLKLESGKVYINREIINAHIRYLDKLL